MPRSPSETEAGRSAPDELRGLRAERETAEALAEAWVRTPPTMDEGDRTELRLFAMYLYANRLREDLVKAKAETEEALRVRDADPDARSRLAITAESTAAAIRDAHVLLLSLLSGSASAAHPEQTRAAIEEWVEAYGDLATASEDDGNAPRSALGPEATE